MSIDLTVKDRDGDELRVYQEDDELFIEPASSRLTVFSESDADELGKLRGAITEFLGDIPAGSNGDGRVLASEVSFNEGLLRLAALHGKTVTFRYAKGNGALIEQRTLKPESVLHVGDHLTFVGFDPDRDEVRSYRVDRMKGEVTVA